MRALLIESLYTRPIGRFAPNSYRTALKATHRQSLWPQRPKSAESSALSAQMPLARDHGVVCVGGREGGRPAYIVGGHLTIGDSQKIEGAPGSIPFQWVGKLAPLLRNCLISGSTGVALRTIRRKLPPRLNPIRLKQTNP